MKTGDASSNALIQTLKSDGPEHPFLDAIFSATSGFASEGNGNSQQQKQEDNGSDSGCNWGRGWGHYRGHDWKHHWAHCDGWGNRAVNHNDWLLHPRKMIWLLSRLRASGVLTSRVAAGFCANLLPRIVAKVANHVEEAGQNFKQKLPQFQSCLQSLAKLVKDTKGLEHCEAALAGLAAMVYDGPP